MSFDRDKRLLLAWLAMLAPLPLPFNEVVGWPLLIAYWLALVLFLARQSKGPAEPLPAWVMNLLGLGYLPFLLFELSYLWQGRALRPLVHLGMFALVVKLFGLKRDKEKWHVFLLIFFLFLAAMGSSVNPSVVLYLIAFLAVSFLVLGRFAGFHVLGSFGSAAEARAKVPLRGFLSWGTLATVVLAVPLFVLLPRLGQPYFVGGPGGGSGPLQTSDLLRQITLDTIGRLRTSRSVVMRFLYENPPPEGHEMRFRGGTFQEFTGRGWRRGLLDWSQLHRLRDGYFHVAQGVPRSWMTLWLQPVSSGNLVLPIETRTVDIRTPTLQVDQTGVVTTLLPARGTLTYRAGLATGPGELPRPTGESELAAALDPSGLTPRISRLAQEVAGSASPAELPATIERHLLREYDYTLDLMGLDSDRPLEDFLFESRRGHCEYFASSMVLMLRSLGIPARLVTGFVGGEYNPFEEYYIVRLSNAHAWVEAYSPELGWQTYDPTPPVGRPGAQSWGFASLLGQAYDYLLFRWDRYVLTYGLYDQVGLAQQFYSWWRGFWRNLRRPGRRAEDEARPERAETGLRTEESAREGLGRAWIPLALVFLLSAWWIWRHRPELSGARAYSRLRSRLRRDPALGLADSVPPIQMGRRLAARYPAAAAPAWRLIELYLLESFGGQDLDEEELLELRRALRETEKGLRKTA